MKKLVKRYEITWFCSVHYWEKHLLRFAFPATNPECLYQTAHTKGQPLGSKLQFAIFTKRSQDYLAGIIGQYGINKKRSNYQ